MGRSTTMGYFVKERLTEARNARNLTQKRLAECIGKSHSTVSNWERGEQAPDPNTLNDIASVLGVFTPYFLKPLPEHGLCPIFFRSLANATARARERERARVRWLQHISLVLQEFLDFPSVDFPSAVSGKDVLRISEFHLEQIAQDLRLHWGLGERPITNMLLVVENAGVIVGMDEVGSSSIDGQGTWSCVDGRPYMLLARDKNTAFRRQMDAAHELAHLVLHKDISTEMLREHFDVIEYQAKYFAGAFLLPAKSFAMEITSLSLDGFLALKPRWKVAVGAMIKRAEQIDLLSKSSAQQLWKYRSARGWHRREPFDHPNETPVEEPRLLRRSFEMIAASKLKSERDLLEVDLALGAADIEMVACLQSGFFGTTPANIIPLDPKPRANTTGVLNADVLQFKRVT